MIKDTGNNWTRIIQVPIDVSVINYNISTIDYYGFTNHTDVKQVNVIDTLEPTLTDNTPSTSGTGNTFIFNATVTDNIAVSQVSVSYYFGTNTPTQEIMNQITGTDYYEKQISIPTDSTDKLYYNLSAIDQATNENYTGINDVLISDDDAPRIYDVANETTSTYVNITCNVTDNIALTRINVTIINPDNTEDNKSMIHLQNDMYYYNVSKPMDLYDYYIWATDTSSNFNKTKTYTFTIG